MEYGDLLKALVGVGPGGIVAGVMFLLWRDERIERRDLQGQVTQLLKDTISSRLELANSLEKISSKIGA
jgi:hypothetical protein